MEYRPIVFKNDIVVPKKNNRTNRFWYAYNSSYLCSKCWTWGGGAKIDIKKYVRRISLSELYPLYLHIFFPIILEKDLIDKKKVVANNILCLVRYIYFMMSSNAKFSNSKGMKWLIFTFPKNRNGFWRK